MSTEQWKVRDHRRGDTGFTLIELLVVVIVVGLLAAIAVPTYLNQRDKAAKRTTEANMRNSVAVVMLARENTRQTLPVITGSVCSNCNCRDVAGLRVNDPAFALSSCGSSWRNAVNKIADAAGEPRASMRALMTDGWGYPIAVDENESETSHGGVCGQGIDTLFSGGPDHMINNGDDILWRISPGGCL